MSIRLRNLGLILALALAPMTHILAATPSVTAVLSNSAPGAGEMVQLEIKVTGATNARAPEDIIADGLQIHRTGEQYESQLRFGFGSQQQNSSSVIYTYTVIPMRSGQFKIPPQTIRVGSESLRTPELVLNVAQGSSGSGSSAQGRQTQTGNRLAFAELVIAKKDAYVGEMIPAEIRLGFDPRARARLQDGPELSGQGFTTQKLQQPRETLETIGGRTYQVYTFKTAISPAHAGKFEIGPVQAKAIVVMPRRPSGMPRTNRPRSPFDLFDMDDPFSDPFFSDPFGNMGERTELPIRSETAALTVKPLPANAPPNFSGAVGSFTMAVDAKPKSVQVGDPVTVSATISGRGNFDRMNGPALEDERGWHKYPSSSKFKQDDDVGISGEKTFETVIAPNERKAGVPPLTFAYFDPVKENYVTLRSEPVPLRVEGGAGPAPTIAQNAATSAARPAPPAATVAPATKPADILYQLNDLGTARSFLPIYVQRTFWIAQIAPLILLLGLVGWKIRQAKIGNREAQRIAARQHEMAKLVRELRRGDVPPQVYFSQAARAVQLKTALAKNINPNAVDAETVASTFDLNENERVQLRRLFERSDELRYSGSGNGDKTIAHRDREEVLRLLESLRA
jgi:oxygen tolerance protein BatD